MEDGFSEWSEDGKVRKVNVTYKNPNETVQRPVQKLIVIAPINCDEQWTVWAECFVSFSVKKQTKEAIPLDAPRRQTQMQI